MFCLTLVGTEWPYGPASKTWMPQSFLLKNAHQSSLESSMKLCTRSYRSWWAAGSCSSVNNLRFPREGYCVMMSWYGYHVMVWILEWPVRCIFKRIHPVYQVSLIWMMNEYKTDLSIVFWFCFPKKDSPSWVTILKLKKKPPVLW